MGKDRCAGRVGLDAGFLNGPGLQRAGEGYLVTVVFHELVEAVPAVRRFKGDPGVLRRRCRKGGQRGGIVFFIFCRSMILPVPSIMVVTEKRS